MLSVALLDRERLKDLTEMLSEINDIDYGNPQLHDSYDYVIVGAGPAGCVLANRLSEDPSVSVLLLEIGRGERPAFSEPPLLGPMLASTDYNFGYVTEPQKYGCLGLTGRRCNWAHGRGVGGSSIINNVIYTRGNRRDFDNWARAGMEGWSWDEVLPYYRKIERANIRDFENNGAHGKDGRVSVEDCPFRSDVSKAFVASAAESGYPYLDYNAGDNLGVSFLQAHTKRGHRVTGGTTYLKDVYHRPNLHVSTRSWVIKILFDEAKKEAVGVRFTKNKRYHTVKARRELIISAGAFETPKLLMNSGVGPAAHLAQHGIKVLQDLPVGRRIYEHGGVFGPIFIVRNVPAIEQNLISLEQVVTLDEILRFRNGTGPLTSNSIESLLYVKSPVAADPDPDMPDVEVMQSFTSFSFDSSTSTRFAYHLPDALFREYYGPLVGTRNFMFLPMLLKPHTVGRLELKSRNPFHHPLFRYQYFEDERDVEALVYSIKEVLRIMQAEPFRRLGVEQYTRPVPGCQHLTFNSDDYWRCHVRTLTTTFEHQVSTCRMGPAGDPEAVVDSRLRVRGIRRLRVADVSIIPEPPSAHTCAMSYLIGEKAADMIKEDNGY
ncbi:glucose dehydrogenase [FAD, quinone]-like [Anopheles ziemanni]|uniref:glucose dehydrogenase [FAD, quinone]-like n=1 Tax=Anopheles coustani TaxID=139045 RepID=UPI002659FE57|nr:glucose dehydrogenase [FAD, quinone]-like [Anopheles coustani]XP_058168498.1 glucose dehydrogenase [FAD, quinone]-like [Anopheles ziemanni]